jgi:hypothetical protein
MSVLAIRRGARDPGQPSANLGEIAVDEYATLLAHTTGPGFVPLVLFEDPDAMELRIARLKDVHLLNTTAWLLTLHREGLLPDGLELVEMINATQEPNGAVRESRLNEEGAIDVAETELRAMNGELKGCSLADVLKKLEKGNIGYRTAMEWLNITSLDDLVEIMHVNGRLMTGHQPMRVMPETRALVGSIIRSPVGAS